MPRLARFVSFFILISITGCSLFPSEAPKSKYRRADSFALAVRPNVQAPVAQMRSEHPRLLVTEPDFTRARELIKTDPLVIKWMKDIRAYADTATNRPPLDWAPGATIEQARNLQQRITHLAFMYRVTGDAKYLSHARDEMLAAAGAANWDGNSFLITAETTTAMAIGYDWLFDTLSDSDRKIIRNAIVEKGLNRARGDGFAGVDIRQAMP